jgi:hypothetical protein
VCTMKKAQSSVILILLILIIFVGLGVFLLSLVETVSQEDYMNIYTHNMIISLLRTDTGRGGECKYVSDVIICGSYGMFCDSGFQCKDVAEEKVNFYMNAMNEIKSIYDWYIGVYDKNDFKLMEFGDESLVKRKTKKWSASETIYKIIGMTEDTYTVMLILAKKP